MNDADAPLPPIEERFSFLIHRIDAQMARLCNPLFRALDVDIVMARMLVVLMEKGALPAGAIVTIMALPQSTISHQLKRLETLGYVTRAADPGDSRIVVARLTETGKAIAARCNELSRQVVSVMVAALDGLDQSVLRRALQRMDAALSTLRSVDPA